MYIHIIKEPGQKTMIATDATNGNTVLDTLAEIVAELTRRRDKAQKEKEDAEKTSGGSNPV